MKNFHLLIVFVGLFLLPLSGDRVPASTRIFETAMKTVCEAELSPWGPPQTKVRVDTLRQLAYFAQKYDDEGLSWRIEKALEAIVSENRGERAAMACYRNAVAVIRNDPEKFSYGLGSMFLAEMFQKHFVCEEAEEAYCLSILSLKKGRVGSDFGDVLRCVESFLLLRDQEKSGPPPEEKRQQELRTQEERLEYWRQSVSLRF